SNRYNQEFAKTWQAYPNATSVVGYASVPDAANKLQQMISPKTPLLEVFCVASDNTAANKQLPPQAFQPVQFVTPPGCFRSEQAPADDQPQNAFAGGILRGIR